MSDSKKSGVPFAVLFLDVDFFKRINDNYGHSVGDGVLVGLAKLLRQECYSGELIARYGGEEFVVVCPDADLPAARRRAERLRLAISQSVLCDEVDVRVTASFGAAAVEPGDTAETLLRRADKALYRSKRTGRNRTCTMTGEDLAEAQAPPPPDPETDDPFLLVSTFKACVAADIAVFKLGGFLREGNAVLADVAPGFAVLRMGRGGLFGGWGKKGSAQPVVVTIEFGDATNRGEDGRQITVRLTVRPLGRIRNSEVFKTRAREVVGLLRSYFAASDS